MMAGQRCPTRQQHSARWAGLHPRIPPQLPLPPPRLSQGCCAPAGNCLCPALQVLLAMLKAARAAYCCPSGPPTAQEANPHFAAYLGRARAAVIRGAGDGATELAGVMWLYTHASMANSYLGRARQFWALAERLADPGCKRRLQRQLEQLAGSHWAWEGRLLTAEQLQHECCASVVNAAINATKVMQAPRAQQVAELQEAAESCAHAMRQLEPNNPKSHIAGADALQVTRDREWMQRQIRPMLQCYLRAFELGQQQGSDFWSAAAAASALYPAACQPLKAGHALLAAAVAAMEQVGDAPMRRCKRLLPDCWVQPLTHTVRLQWKPVALHSTQLPTSMMRRWVGTVTLLIL